LVKVSLGLNCQIAKEESKIRKEIVDIIRLIFKAENRNFMLIFQPGFWVGNPKKLSDLGCMFVKAHKHPNFVN